MLAPHVGWMVSHTGQNKITLHWNEHTSYSSIIWEASISTYHNIIKFIIPLNYYFNANAPTMPYILIIYTSSSRCVYFQGITAICKTNVLQGWQLSKPLKTPVTFFFSTSLALNLPCLYNNVGSVQRRWTWAVVGSIFSSAATRWHSLRIASLGPFLLHNSSVFEKSA